MTTGSWPRRSGVLSLLCHAAFFIAACYQCLGTLAQFVATARVEDALQPVHPAERYMAARVLDLLASPALSQPRRRLSASTQPIRLHVEYTLDSSLSASDQAALRVVMTAAVAELQRLLVGVRRAPTGPLTLPMPCAAYKDGVCVQIGTVGYCYASPQNPDFFGSYVLCAPQNTTSCFTFPGGAGLANTDAVVYVSNASKLPDGSAACVAGEDRAVGGWCVLDPTDSRPIATFINWCPDGLAQLSSPALLPGLVDTAVHEMMHGLGFTRTLFDHYVDASTGIALGSANTVAVDASGAVQLTTPSVRLLASSYFRCTSLKGLPLETNGGSATAGSHQNQAIVPIDLMTGVDVSFGRERITSFTAAAFNDTGWYVVDTSAFAPPVYALWAGCDFLNDVAANRCTESPLPASLSTGTFAVAGTTNACSPDLRGIGAAAELELHPGCYQVRPYSDRRCGDAAVQHSTAGEQASVFGSFFGQGSQCIAVSMPGTQQTRSVADSAETIDVSRSAPGAQCMRMQCEGSVGSYKLYVDLFGALIECPGGKTVTVGGSGAVVDFGLSSTILGPCPDPEKLCPTLGCPGDCNDNGACYMGSCQCYPGYAGSDCSVRTCGQCDPAFETCDVSTNACVGTAPLDYAAAFATLAGPLQTYMAVDASGNPGSRPTPVVVRGVAMDGYLSSCPVLLDTDGDRALTYVDVAQAPLAVTKTGAAGDFRAINQAVASAPLLLPCPDEAFGNRCQGCADRFTGLPPLFPLLSVWQAPAGDSLSSISGAVVGGVTVDVSNYVLSPLSTVVAEAVVLSRMYNAGNATAWVTPAVAAARVGDCLGLPQATGSGARAPVWMEALYLSSTPTAGMDAVTLAARYDDAGAAKLAWASSTLVASAAMAAGAFNATSVSPSAIGAEFVRQIATKCTAPQSPSSAASVTVDLQASADMADVLTKTASALNLTATLTGPSLTALITSVASAMAAAATASVPKAGATGIASLERAASMQYVSRTSLAPLAAQLASGQVSMDAFAAQTTPQAIASAASAALASGTVSVADRIPAGPPAPSPTPTPAPTVVAERVAWYATGVCIAGSECPPIIAVALTACAVAALLAAAGIVAWAARLHPERFRLRPTASGDRVEWARAEPSRATAPSETGRSLKASGALTEPTARSRTEIASVNGVHFVPKSMAGTKDGGWASRPLSARSEGRALGPGSRVRFGDDSRVGASRARTGSAGEGEEGVARAVAGERRWELGGSGKERRGASVPGTRGEARGERGGGDRRSRRNRGPDDMF